MNYKEVGFRAFYHHFCVLPITKTTKAAISDFPGAKTANGVLTYGYYDRDAGITLEVLAAAQVKGESASFGEPSKDTRSMIRIDSVAEEDFLFFADEDGSLAKRYANKIEMLHHYDADEDVEKTREMTFLDSCRDKNYIDDILVYILKKGNQPEGCWARIVGLGDRFFKGILLNEPNQDFGCHAGEKIKIFVQQTEEERIICCADMDLKLITAEDLEDGKMLESAVSKCHEEKDKSSFIDLLEILRDSYVWVPCTAIMGDTDQARWEALIDESEDHQESLIGKEFVTHDVTRLVPDILQNGAKLFFPVFSNVEAMGEYGNHFSKVQKHILEVIPLARNQEKDIAGIVLNAFSEPFVLEKEIWEIVENMQSRVETFSKINRRHE